MAPAVPKQIPSLTPLRGIAALLVVVFHLRFYIPNLNYAEYMPAFHAGYLWVDFFFILSGFVISHVYGSDLERGLRGFAYRRFMYARFCRIYPLHFVVLGAFVVFEFVQIALHSGFGLLPGFTAFRGHHAPEGLLSSLLLVNTLHVHDRLLWNFPSWSISAEWVAYLMFPLLFLALYRRAAAPSWLAFSLLLGLLNLLAMTNGGRLAIHYDYGALRCLLEFSIGILVYKAYQSDRLGGLLKSDVGFLLAIAWIAVGMTLFLPDIFVVPAFAGLVLTAARNGGLASRVLNTRPMLHLGEISYSIYMVNILTFLVVKVVWKVTRGESFGAGFNRAEAWLAWVLALGLVVAVSTLTHRFVEKPAARFLKRVAPSRLASVPARSLSSRSLEAEQLPS